MQNIPSDALVYGFVNNTMGTHGSRTIILAELRASLAACPASSTIDAYRVAVVDDNVLLKRTATTRRESFRRLRELYALTPDTLLFYALRELWDADAEAQPLLALLCACARDALLRGTVELILTALPHASVTPGQISAAVDDSFPSRYSPTTLANVGRHAASSWRQSGHLEDRLRKRVDAYAPLGAVLTTVSGEIDRQLAGSKIGPVMADAPDLVPDYPLLPVRRRFWERVLRAVDSAGTAGQLRTQLRIVHEAAKAVASRPVGIYLRIIDPATGLPFRTADEERRDRIAEEQARIAAQGRANAEKRAHRRRGAGPARRGARGHRGARAHRRRGTCGARGGGAARRPGQTGRPPTSDIRYGSGIRRGMPSALQYNGRMF